MASPDIVFNAGIEIDETELRRQIAKLDKAMDKPRLKFDKIVSGAHETTQRSILSGARQIRSLTGITPTQAVRFAAGGTPRAGTHQRQLFEGMVAQLTAEKKAEESKIRLDKIRTREAEKRSKLEAREAQDAQKREKKIAEAEVKEAKKRGEIATAVGMLKSKEDISTSDWRKIGRLATAIDLSSPIGGPSDDAQRELIDLLAARKEEERQSKIQARQLALDEERNKGLEALRKDASGERALSPIEWAKAQRIARGIEWDKPFGGEYKSKEDEEFVTLVQERQDRMNELAQSAALASRRVAMLSSVLTGLGAAGKAVWTEFTREKDIYKTSLGISGYRYRNTEMMGRLGVDEGAAIAFQKKTGSFLDRLRFGEVSGEEMSAYARFGRRTYAAMRANPNDKVAILQAIQADVLEGEQRGYSRQYMLGKLDFEGVAASLGWTPDEIQQKWDESIGADYQQMRGESAYRGERKAVGFLASLKGYKSQYKTGSLIGGGIGAGAAALGTGLAVKGAVTGGTIGGPVGALLGAGLGLVAGYGGAYIGSLAGAWGQDLLTPDSGSSGASITTQNNVEISITGDAMREMLDNGSYVSTFESTASIDVAQ